MGKQIEQGSQQPLTTAPDHSALLRTPGRIAISCTTGMAVGFGSSITGTSGPVLLLPVLMLVRWPILPALGHAQAIQVPIATLATLGHLVCLHGSGAEDKL